MGADRISEEKIKFSLLIIGGSSFLGAHLLQRLSRLYQVHVTSFRNSIPTGIWHLASGINLDITDKREANTIVNSINPAVIIHTAANTNLHDCEENPATAQALNVGGTKNLATAAKEVGARFIYLSTDSVFDGSQGFYSEADQPQPINVYGQTKLEGEKVVSTHLSDYVILRIALLYGWSLTASTSFTEDIVYNLSKGKTINAFTDEYRNPLHVLNLCEIIEEIIQTKTIKGLLHLAGSQRVNRYEQALKVAEIFGLDKSLISPITTDEIKSLTYKRPKDCSMNTEKLRSVITTPIWTLEEGLMQMYHTWLR